MAASIRKPEAMVHIFLYLGSWTLCAFSTVLAQDSSKHALTEQAQQVSTDSSLPAGAVSSAREPAVKHLDDAGISEKDWITWGIALLPFLLTIVTLVFASWLARKKKEAELRAEHEYRQRLALEEQQRRKEEQLASLTVTDEFVRRRKEQEQATVLRTAEEHYRNALETEVCRIHLAAPGIEETPVSLDETFVHLNISEHYRSENFPKLGEPGRAGGGQEDLTPEEVMQRAFGEFQRQLLLIIGDPGSGKTTLLKYYALCCLKPDGARRFGFDGPVFPFYLPLREIDPAESLAGNLAKWTRQRVEAPISPEEFQHWLASHDSLILLDGLDEISGIEERKAVCRWIDRRITGSKRGRFVVTSRGTGIRSKNLMLDTPHLRAEIRDFSPEQKKEFLYKWFRNAHLEGSRRLTHETEAEWRERQLREAKNNAEQVIAYLDQPENRSLRELAGIPMLLQLIALVWQKQGARPKSRTKLYDIALDYLLEYRDDHRGLKPLLTADEARRVLSPVALWMQEELNAEEVPKDKMHGYVKPILEPISNSVGAEELCANLRDRAGLLADYGKNDYIFRHKSFREYFAGLQLVNSYAERDRLALLVKTFGEAGWNETLRYFLSKADGRAFTAFMTALFSSAKSRELSHEQQDLLQALVREAPEKPIEALLACLRDSTRNQLQQRYALDCLKIIGGDRVRKALTAYLQTPSANANTDTLAYAREIIAALAAPADFAVRLAGKPKLFVELPAAFHNPVEYNAEYILIRGGTIEYEPTQKNEKVLDLYFAKYPVTYKQYRRFIRYLNGEESDLLDRIPLNRFKQKLFALMAKPLLTPEEITRFKESWLRGFASSYDDHRRFNGEEQPVVGVDWFAARAYCFWLSLLEAEVLGLADDTRVQQVADLYRLPNEIEWQRAAGGRLEDGPSRKYPWLAAKGEPNEKLANYGMNVGQTTPVGRYPKGATPEGLMDMAGNVWEWQGNCFFYRDIEFCALRGGSWNYSTLYLRCAIRDGDSPHIRGSDIGFRVVRAQSSFDTL